MKQNRILFIIAMLSLLFTGCGQNKSEENSHYYGEIIAGLGDEEQFALEDIGEKMMFYLQRIPLMTMVLHIMLRFTAIFIMQWMERHIILAESKAWAPHFQFLTGTNVFILPQNTVWKFI